MKEKLIYEKDAKIAIYHYNTGFYDICVRLGNKIYIFSEKDLKICKNQEEALELIKK